MEIITLDKVSSTNDFLKDYSKTNDLKDFTVVVARHQTFGRGQMGNSWYSEPHKNITMSIFRNISFFPEEQFYMSMGISISIYRLLKTLGINNVKIKWPNDIMIKNSKVCGILVNNVFFDRTLKSCIVGIGLNVNQITFKGLPHATSLRKVTQKDYKLEPIEKCLLEEMQSSDLIISEKSKPIIQSTYNNLLYNSGKVSTYRNNRYGQLFNGIIQGVDSSGRLGIKTDSDILEYYNTKEISFLYNS